MNFETKKEIPAGPNCYSADGKKCDFLRYESGDCHDYYYCNINDVFNDPVSGDDGPSFLKLHSYLKGNSTEDRKTWWLPKDLACAERFPEGTIVTTTIDMWAYNDKEST